MTDQEKKVVRSEILKFGPSPYFPNDDLPLAALFHNEMEDIVGTVETDIFGQVSTAYLILTTFRLILYKYNKTKDDEVLSFWFDLDLSNDSFHDTEGFTITRVETTIPEYRFDEKIQRPIFTWQYNFYNQNNVKKEAANIEIYPQTYYYRKENKFSDVLKPISLPGFKWKGEDTYLGIVPFGVKLSIFRHGPAGKLHMIDLQILHKSPEIASFHEAGEVPEDCPLHENKAKRDRVSINVKEKPKKGTAKQKAAAKIRKAKKTTQEKKSEKTTAKAHSSKAEGEKKQTDKKSWKQAASTAIDIGSKLKGGWDIVSKATAAAASTTASSIKDLTEKTIETTEKAGESLKQSIDNTLSDAPNIAGKNLRVCVSCGAPLRSGALFCGKCGQKVMDKIVDEAKDQVKSKIEDKVVEKAKEYLNETPQPESAKKEKEQNPRDVPISDSDLPKNIVTALGAAGLETMGDLADFSSEDSKQLTTIKGIGPAAVKTIQKTVKNIPVIRLKEKPEEKTEKKSDEKGEKQQTSAAFCRKCGKALQSDWSFCPYCQTSRQMVCAKCGNEIKANWNYCPFCNTKIN